MLWLKLIHVSRKGNGVTSFYGYERFDWTGHFSIAWNDFVYFRVVWKIPVDKVRLIINVNGDGIECLFDFKSNIETLS